MRLKYFFQQILLILALPVIQAAGQVRTEEETTIEPPERIVTEEFSAENIPTEATDTRLLSPWLNTDNGFTATPVYFGEVFTNAHGGIGTKHATQYEGLLDLALSFDFQKMELPIPGRATILFENTHGRGLNPYVGATQITSNIDSLDNITQISELWWEFDLFDEAVTFRIGRQDLSTEFIAMETASDFINSAFGLSPSAGLPSFPAPSSAAMAMIDLSPSLKFRTGVWDAFRTDERGTFSQNGSILFISELEYRYTTSRNQLPGIISFGMTYETPGEVSVGVIPRAFGYYLQIEQMLYREADSTDDNPQGLSLFAQHYPTNTNGRSPFPEIPEDGLAGIVYRGLLRGRDEDVAGAGLGWVKLTEGGTGEEFMVELFYKAKINSTLSIQPDIQYINTPSGIYSNALVVGLRVQLDL